MSLPDTKPKFLWTQVWNPDSVLIHFMEKRRQRNTLFPPIMRDIVSHHLQFTFLYCWSYHESCNVWKRGVSERDPSRHKHSVVYLGSLRHRVRVRSGGVSLRRKGPLRRHWTSHCSWLCLFAIYKQSHHRKWH